MIGKTIKEIIEGEKDGWDIAMILKMTDNTMYMIESGSGNSRGILFYEEIKEIPNDFEVKPF